VHDLQPGIDSPHVRHFLLSSVARYPDWHFLHCVLSHSSQFLYSAEHSSHKVSFRKYVAIQLHLFSELGVGLK
jgi:hypothetical protein